MTTTVTFVTGSPIYDIGTPGSFYTGTGNNLVGTTVTAYWDDNSSETATFADSGGSRGDAIGTGWRLYLDGNDGPLASGTVDPQLPYYADVWKFVFEGQTNALTKLVIDATPSTTYVIFDADNSTTPPDGTPGSGGGITWEIFSGLSGTDVAVTYDKVVRYNGTDIYEDLYLRITLEFSGTAVTSDFSFFQDHDYLNQAPAPVTTTRRRVHVCVHV